MMDRPDEIGAALSHVRWLGGGSGAGKTTIAARLARRHGAVVYGSDDSMGDHAGRCPPGLCPRLEAFRRMSMDDRWVRRAPQVMLETFHWYHGEAFDLIVEDLCALPRDRPVIAEGFRLLPRLVAPLLRDRNRALWLLPTPTFRSAAFAARGTMWDIPRRTSDPERALRNLLDRDAMFTERLRQEATALDLETMTVDGSLSEDELLDLVDDRLFGR